MNQLNFIKNNFHSLMVFLKVFELKNMTKASKILGLTQPGVSQHIKSLEFNLGKVLFIRDKKEVIPTKEAEFLYENFNLNLTSLDLSLRPLFSENPDELYGTIKIGLPVEFGNQFIVPLLGKLGKKYPKLNFEIHYGFANQFERDLESNLIDLAFIDDYKMKEIIQTKIIFKEDLFLCAHENYLLSFMSKEKLYDQEYWKNFDYSLFEFVTYDANGSILSNWFEEHLLKKIDFNINIKCICSNTQGVGQLILNGIGAGILPSRYLSLLPKKNKIISIKATNLKAKNIISISYLKQKREDPIFNQFYKILLSNLTTDYFTSN